MPLVQNDSLYIRPNLSQIGDIQIDCSIEENHSDELVITEHPVEQGAEISDHAYKRPAECGIRAGWSNSSQEADGDENYIRDIYRKLLALQESRITFTLLTQRRVYQNMLIANLGAVTDNETQNILSLTMGFRQVIIVSTSTVKIPPKALHAHPQKTAPIENKGTKRPESSLFNLFGGGQ